MKKIFTYFIVLLLIGVAYFFYALYPKFDIISGFSSKSIASHHFLANRSQEYTEANDNNIPSMKLAKTKVNDAKKTVTSSVFGLKKRKVVFTEGLGSVLIPQGKEPKQRIIPKRNKKTNDLAFPYGDATQKDTVFANIDYKKLNKAVAEGFDLETNDVKKTRTILVIYKDQIIAEKYKKGFNKNSLILGWSMAKSITSAVVGVLEKKGKLNLDQTNLFDEWKNDDRKKITLRNLLNMNSGLEWEEDYGKICDVTQMLFLDDNMSTRQKNKQFVGKPNETWNYSSGTSNLLSDFIKQQFSSQQAYADFWYTELIDKIGMQSMLIEADYSGNYIGSSYAWATTRDWAKFGLLYLHNGNWNGEQILNKSWVDFTRKPTNTSKGEYGGHFWLNAGGIYPDAPKDLYSCNGYQGQRVFIIPSKDLVIIRTGLASSEFFDYNEFITDVVKSID